MLLRCIHKVTCICSFFISKYYYIVCLFHNVFIHSLIEGHLGFYYFFLNYKFQNDVQVFKHEPIRILFVLHNYSFARTLIFPISRLQNIITNIKKFSSLDYTVPLCPWQCLFALYKNQQRSSYCYVFLSAVGRIGT